MAEPTTSSEHSSLGRVLVVAVTFNGRDAVGSTLRALAEQTYAEFDLLVVDNGSNDGTPDLIQSFALPRPVEVLELGENLGVATALNRGIAVAVDRGYEWVLLSDQDTIASPKLLTTFARALRKNEGKRIGALFPLAGNAFRPELTNPPLRWVNHNLVPPPPDEMQAELVAVDSSLTSGTLLRTEAFIDVGGFREDLFIDYVDHEFNLRLRRAGWDLYCVTAASVQHRLGNERAVKTIRGTEIYREHAPFRYYYIARNLLFCHLNLFEDGGSAPWVLAKIGAATLRILRHDSRRARSLVFIARGVVDGLLGRMGPRVRP